MVSLDRYDVTKDGQIFDKQTNKPVKIFKSNKYLQCCIYDENGKHVMGVHNVVAQVYCEDWFEGCVVHHKDNNQHNNNVENLECLERREHTKHHNPNKYFDKMQTCAYCGKEFLWTHIAQSHFYRSGHETGPYCSKECSGKYSAKFKAHAKKIKCIETGEIFESIMEAHIKLKISYEQLANCCRGKYKSAHGLHFAFV